MAEHFVHVTEAGERWDTIAHRYYGDARRLTELFDANPGLVGRGPAPLVFAAGEEVVVPALPEAAPAVQLPPWRR